MRPHPGAIIYIADVLRLQRTRQAQAAATRLVSQGKKGRGGGRGDLHR